MRKTTYQLIQVTLALVFFILGGIIYQDNFGISLALWGIALMFASNWMVQRIKN